MNGAELYFLGRRLTQIAVGALADDSYLRRVTPGARLVLEDGAGHPGTTAGEIAGRTGLQPAQVSALLEDLAARRKAGQRSLAVSFEVRDALELGALGAQFDTVIDSALFHVLDDEDRIRYEAGLRQVIPPGGRYLMLCFSDVRSPGFGPRRVSRREIEDLFTGGWRVDAIDPATIEVTFDPAGVPAWRTSLTRL